LRRRRAAALGILEHVHTLRTALTAVTFLGALQAVAGLLAVRWFASRQATAPRATPPVTILKPVCGDETLLEEAIASFCTQDYPEFELIIGAHTADDPALHAARRVQARFPAADIKIVVDGARHGSNRKIANLINMMPCASHDVLVIADSDLHVRPDYLSCIVATLEQPGCGLVTTGCGAEPAQRAAASLLGVSHISHSFLPGALLGAAGGRQDCLGGTMALRRSTLARIGGLHALVNNLADDNLLGSLVRSLGLTVRMAPTLPVVVVQERTLHALWQHELRWARTIRALAPAGFAASALQFPLFWSLLAIVLSAGAPWAITCFLAAWGVRAAVAWGIDHSLRARRARPAPPAALWLLPLRDLLSMAILAASFWDDEVVWRGHVMHADRPAVAINLPDEEAIPKLMGSGD
jgi:ceramide glucosyltransferase